MTKNKKVKESEPDKPKVFCRICNQPYLNSNTSIANLFHNKRDPSSLTWISKLKSLDITLQERSIYSDNSICKTCQTSVTNVINSLQQLKEWRDKFGTEENKACSSRKRASDGAEVLIESKLSKATQEQSVRFQLQTS